MSAANAIAGSLRRLDAGTQTLIVDSYEYAAAVVSRVVSDGYLRMVKSVPQLYRYIYHRAERATEVGRFRTWAHQFTAANLRELISSQRPDVVVCTHAFPCGAMAEYKRLYDPSLPLVGVVTDFAVHAFWMHDAVDAYAVATADVRAAMIDRGIAPERVMDSGIPVLEDFRLTDEGIDDLRERLNLPRNRRVVLLMGGGLGIAPLERMMDGLRQVNTPLTAVVIAGRNESAQRRVTDAAQDMPYPVRLLAFVDNVYDYMHAADVLVTKPGGLTVAEALVAQVPIVLCRPLPGQEERNVRVLLKNKAALRVRRIEELPAALERLFEDDAARAGMREAARRLARPRAAMDAASMIAGLTAMPREVVA